MTLSIAGTRGQEETVTQRACLLKNDPNPGGLGPQRWMTVSRRVPCSRLKGPQTQKGKPFSEKPPSVSFDGAKELSWASRRGGEKKEEFPVPPE